VKRVRKRVLVSGRVQGVWFRESTRRQAVELGLTGWVRNLPDGRVEAEFEGTPDAVAQALDFVRVGPKFAQVDEVTTTRSEECEENEPSPPVSFQIR